SKAQSSRPQTWSCTIADTQMPPGSATPSSRAAMLTPSPWMSPSSTMMSPRIDADAEFDAPVFRRGGIPRPHPALHGHGAGDRLDDARKFDQEPVAGRLDDAAPMLGDHRVDQLAA